MRQIFLDTETTGLSPEAGDRVIEIGCVEMVNRRLTGQTRHYYLNPERSSSPEALEVHGLTDEFLADIPKFAEIADDFLAWLQGAEVIIHNAAFDVGFLNKELELAGKKPFTTYVNGVVDTLVMAKQMYPGKRNSLDALCDRLGVDNSGRTLHGALLDAEILAEVYVELMGGKQADLGLADSGKAKTEARAMAQKKGAPRERPSALTSRLSEDDIAAHLAFVRDLNADVIWSDYIRDSKAE